MPYILSPLISKDSPGMWFEGPAYEKKSIYSIEANKMPPVNYDEHILRCHSLTHIETPAHTQADGKRVGKYYEQHQHYFFGKTLVIRLSGNNYQAVGNGIFHWKISVAEIQSRLDFLQIEKIPPKILITTSTHLVNDDGYHDPGYVLTLTPEAADFLIEQEGFNLYGTSWKSSDYNPGKADRPIHNTIFKKGLILENLRLDNVPEGIFFMTSFPLPLKDASESPVVPVLFSKEEILDIM